MIASLSQLSRRVIALALLFVVVVTALNLVILPTANWVTDTLDALTDARFRHGHLAAEAAQLPLPSGDRVAPDCCLGGSMPGAQATLLGLINGAASNSKVTFERATPVPTSTPDMVVFDIVASAPDAAMMRFIDQLERGTPIVRLTRWQLDSPDTPHGPVRLEARIAAAWRSQR